MKFKLSRKFQARKRMIRNQLSSLILYGQIKTTRAKAKALKSEMQKLVCDLKKSEGHILVRKADEVLYGGASKKAVDILQSIESVSVLKLPPRSGDSAPLAVVVLNKKTLEAKDKVTEKKVSKKLK